MKATVVFQKNWNAIHALDENGKRKYRYIINTGSSRSSKTGSLIQVCDLYARENLNKRVTAWRDEKKLCKDTVLDDALKYMKMWGTYKVNQDFNKTESVFTYSTASTFEMHGTDDHEKTMGLNKAVAWLNEPYKISRDTFDQIDQRTEDFILIDWNPKKGHWIDDLEKDPRSIVIHSTFRDNPFCPAEQRIKILSYQSVKKSEVVISGLLSELDAKAYDVIANKLLLTPKQLNELIRCKENEFKNSANDFNWDVYGLGIKAEKPHRIFRWEEISIDAYNAINAKIYTGVDWGKVDPWGVVDAKYYDGCLYLNEKNYLSEDNLRIRLTPVELAQIQGSEEGFVVWYFHRFGIPKDREIICDTNRPLKTAGLRKAGWVRAVPATNKSIIDGIDLLSELKVYYTSTSLNLKYEQENYSRLVDKYGIVQEEPEDENNHLIDPTRYIGLHLKRMNIIRNV
jgi:PBSX family phage terminase large subunit